MNSTGVFLVVSFSTDVCIGMHLIIVAESRCTIDRGVMHDVGTGSNAHMRPNVGVGSYLDAFIQFSSGLNNCGRMDFSSHS